MYKFGGFFMALVLFFMAPSSMAAEALVGQYLDHTGASITVSLLDNGKGRIDLNNEAYFLIDGQNIWVISTYLDDQWTKNDFVERTKEAVLASPGMLQKYTYVSVVDTGYVSEIMGYESKTFEVTVAGTGEVYELILSQNKDVARLSKAIMIFFQDMSQPIGSRDVIELINDKLKSDYGVLKLDRELTLNKVERREYDSGYFEIPVQFQK